ALYEVERRLLPLHTVLARLVGRVEAEIERAPVRGERGPEDLLEDLGHAHVLEDPARALEAEEREGRADLEDDAPLVAVAGVVARVVDREDEARDAPERRSRPPVLEHDVLLEHLLRGERLVPLGPTVDAERVGSVERLDELDVHDAADP